MSAARRAVPIAVAVAAVGAALAGVFVVQRTPGHECNPLGHGGAPRVSVPSGFHDEPFEVELVGVDGPVHYTLDGSHPDPRANPGATRTYGSAVEVRDRTPEPPRLARIRTAIDVEAFRAGRSAGPTWDVAAPDIPKATVLRARAGDGPECVAVWFVGAHQRRDALPVLHLAADPDHLFDRQTGIYVPGAVHDKFLRSERFDPDGRPWRAPGNYTQRGRAWERPMEHDLDRSVVLHHFEPGGGLAYTTNLGLRIHGGVTRTFPQKSLRFYARNDYGNRVFEHPFFGDDGPAEHRRLILRSSGNDCHCVVGEARHTTHLLDSYLQGLVAHLRVDTQAAQPVVLYLNGEYWGIHHLRERLDRHHLAIRHGVDPDDVSILGAGLVPDETDPAIRIPLRALLDHVAAHDPTDDAVLAHVTERVDLDNFVDYLAVQLFAANSDWPVSNEQLWRERVEGDRRGPGPRDGRWRWQVFDLDAVTTQGRFDPTYDQVARLTGSTPADPHRQITAFLFNRLLANEAFRERFLTRFADLLNTAFDPARTVPELDALEALLAPEMPHQVARWLHGADVDDWRRNVEALRDFMRRRPGLQRAQLAAHFGLGTTEPVRVRTDPAAGTVRVNTVEVAATTPGVADPSDWSGVYFAGLPVRLEARPAPGQRFVGWRGLPGGPARSPVVEVTLAGPLTVEAVFDRRD